MILALADMSTMLNTYGLLGLAILHALEMVWTRKNRLKNHEDIKAVRIDVGDVKQDVKNVKRTVDGPMGVALQGMADALEIAAKAIPGDPNLILKAVAAQKDADEHRATMRQVEEEARLDYAAKARIIAEWKAAQNPPIP